MRVWRRHPILLAGGAVMLASLACAWGEDTVVEEAIPFNFAAPEQVIVKKGESLSLIAEREGCTVEELRTWNQLETDELEIGQQLLLWTNDTERAVPKDGSDRDPKVAAVPRAAPRPRPAPKPSWNPLRVLVGGSDKPEPAADDGLASADEVRVVEPVEVEVDDGGRRPVLVRGAGVLGVDLGDDEGTDLERAAAGMEKRGSGLDGSGLDQRGGGLGGGGEADSFDVEGRQPGSYGGVQIPNTPVKPPRLSRPSPKACLRGPRDSDLQSDNDVVTTKGLDDAQIRAGMSRVVRASSQCFPAGTSGSYEVVVELTVGCDGVTDHAKVVAAGPVPNHVTSCIAKTMEYAGFAAHARPNGVAFQYPLKYSF